MDIQLGNTAWALYSAAFLCGIAYLLQGGTRFFRLSFISATGGFAFNSSAILCRWMEAGHAPLTDIYETLVFLAWATWFAALVIGAPRRMRALLAIVPAIPAACLGYASTLDPSIRPLFPALRSNWLTIHVAAIFLGYAGFAAAFVAGLGLGFSILRGRSGAKWEDEAVVFTRFGFIFLTYGILTGAVWANEAWTRYWGWDPKEIWALLTWIFYFFFLLLRSRGRREAAHRFSLPLATALCSVGGFIFVLFTYFGVSFLLRGLHSYL